MANQLHNQHLLWRAAFGPEVGQLANLHQWKPAQVFKTLQKASAKEPVYLDVADNFLKGLMAGVGNAAQMARNMSDEEKRMVRQKQRDGVRNLNQAWMQEMVASPAQLREKLAFFWHGHFATRNVNVFYQQELLHKVRIHALGSFRTLLHEVSKSAAILNFLNAGQNRKGHPNENFAREVMELFTLGRGHYTEQDVKEAARAFTGWSASLRGEFVFRPFQHDAGTKTILGRTGNFTGEEVLDLLLEQKQTASFIARKMYRFFVNEQVDEEKLNWLAGRFYSSQYDIGKLVEDIFTSNWFFATENIGTRIKSPVELLAGLQRMLPATWENTEVLLLVQQVLGQVLFYPPNVAGWPGGKNWIDSSTLMTRLRLPLLMTANDEWNLQAKTDDDQQMGLGRGDGGGRMGRLLQASINWKPLFAVFEKVPRAQLSPAIAGYLLQSNTRPADSMLQTFTDSSTREGYIASVATRLMASPEYQLC